MTYSFSNDIFQNPNERHLDLIEKIWHTSKDRHFLFIGDNENYTVIKESEWYKHLRLSHKEEIDSQVVASLNIGRNKKKLLISNQETTAFSLIEAHEILHKPLTVILENMDYDRYFIDALIKNFKELGQKIKKYYDNGWLTYINGGGSNIVNVINGLKDRFEKNKSDFPKESQTYLRTLIIIDSDKRFPTNQEVAGDKMATLAIIKQNSDYHVTQKREIENYLPDEIFNEIVGNDNFKRAYLKLKPIQKDFFDLEKGLPDKNFDQLEEELRNLYHDIEEADKKTFRKESMQFLKIDGKKDNFKARFPMLFESKNITRKNLEARANSKELEIILQKINDLL
ncbi:MAG: hypothetical protein MUF58_08210 [Arcicella sp.]|jgi:hypothetical protein|nr:hypothetical protein [Arcicella sp.]